MSASNAIVVTGREHSMNRTQPAERGCVRSTSRSRSGPSGSSDVLATTAAGLSGTGAVHGLWAGFARWLFVVVAFASFAASAADADKKIVLIAGKPSHPPGMHEFRAGCLLLKSCLDHVPGITTVVYSNGWPAEASALDGANAVVIYADGGGGHPAIQGDHRQILEDLARKGVGLGFMHYGVEVPATNGGPELTRWIGGFYEHLYSVNPMWSPNYLKFPANHPISRGVEPFSTRDEWYFNIRFEPSMAGVTPILVATPSDQVRNGPYVYPPGPYRHVIADSGREETMMWVFERPNGARGFGFTGGHTHANWGDPNQRKIVLNAILWIAGAEVPDYGVTCLVQADDLKRNLDPKGAR